MPIGQTKNSSNSSKVFINIHSPNFKSKNPDEIINSLQKQSYFNVNKGDDTNENTEDQNVSNENEPLLKRGSSSSVSSHTPKLVSSFSSNRPSFDNNSLNREGADITRDIYNIINNNNNITTNRNYSSDDIDLLLGTSLGSIKSGTPPIPDFVNTGRRESTASALNVPGGFRRFHIVQKLDPTNSQPSGPNINNNTNNNNNNLNNNSTNAPFDFDNNGDMSNLPFLTRNFMEFLYFYGHFAGESLEDELYDDDDIYGEDSDEQQPLLPLDKKLVRRIERMINPSKTKGSISTLKAFLLLIKSFIGTGILFLPKAFSNGGLLFSCIALLFCGIYSYWCYYILVLSKTATNVSSFGDIGLKLYGKWLKFLILFSLSLTQLGFSSAYVVFTSKNLEAFMRNVFKLDLSIQYFLVLQILLFIPLSFIRNVAKLSLTSLIANFLTLAGLIIVVFYVLKELIYNNNFKPAEGMIPIFNSNSFTVAIGTFIFSFEGIGLIIPVSESMKHPEQFPKVLILVIGISTFMFISVATLGYSAYGAKIQTIILLNLPQTSIFVNLIQFFYSLAIMLSTPLQLFPAIAIIESKIFQKLNKNKKQKPKKEQLRIKWMKNSLRSFIVLFTILVAFYGSNNLDRFVSIVGCFACIPLVYIFPPMLHLRAVSKGSGNKNMVYFDYVLIVFGVLSMAFTSYQTITSG
ncbi:hypothetical protein HANVADRAFT_24334 [Hanseniaspora valbyensis NRRL Y-1626]|uniref:Amino acid transporter transmembrane domain-containing protein n=1 Tax=Hanseniaspora valbyensis NRRL Y-1626 TaxID=766949 RepID=A0A1B7TE42_9ASCO|nr:hypothetical protein HANVADRAFT_24334 [Hanseniaspora valbyensis NRRL Y-1626]